MTTIKATCPTCGEVVLAGDDVTLRVCPVPSLSFYAFRCPTCRVRVSKPADENVVLLLVSGDVEAEPWAVPAEVGESRAGQPLTYDDLLDFGLLLGEDDDLARLAAVGVPT